MARPLRKSLSYFNVDVQLDADMEYLEAIHGIEGFAVVVKLWQRIYGGEGYYMNWNDRLQVIFYKQNGIESKKLEAILDTCFECQIFDLDMYDKKQILTSKGIQKRYSKIVKEAKRKGCGILPEYDLINTDCFGVSSGFITEETPKKPVRNPEESTQSKVKESKKKGISSSSNPAGNSNLEEIQKNESPPTTAVPPLSGNEYKSELEADPVFTDNTCLTYKLTKAQFWEKYVAFIDQKKTLGELVHADYVAFRKNLYFWIGKNKTYQNPKGKGKVKPLPDSKIIDSSKYEKYKSGP